LSGTAANTYATIANLASTGTTLQSQINSLSVGGGVVFSGKSTNYIPKWSANVLTASSSLYDDGTNVGVGTATSLTQTLTVANSGASVTGLVGIAFRAGNDAQQRNYSAANIVAGYTDFNLWSNSYLKVQTHVGNFQALTDTATFTNGRLGVLTSSPVSALDVSGVITCSSVTAPTFNGTATGADTLDGYHGSYYASVTNLAATGTTLSTAINDLSGFDASTYYPKTNPSGYVTTGVTGGLASQSWVSAQSYATAANLASTGATLNTAVNNLSGYDALTYYPKSNPSGFLTTGQSGAFASIINLALTGSSLQTQINNLAVGGGVVFSGKTDNYLPKWSSNVLTATSKIFDDGTNIGIGGNSPGRNVDIFQTGIGDQNAYLRLTQNPTNGSRIGGSSRVEGFYNDTANGESAKLGWLSFEETRPGANDIGGKINFYTKTEGGALTDNPSIKATILPNGNFGINASAPTTKLEIAHAGIVNSNANILKLTSNLRYTDSTGAGLGILFSQNADGTLAAIKFNEHNGTNGSQIRFQTQYNTVGGLRDVLIVHDNAKVSVNKATPVYDLDVNGSVGCVGLYPSNVGLSLYDASSIESINVANRQLTNTVGATSLDWNNKSLVGNWSVNALSISGSPAVSASQTGLFATSANLNSTGAYLQTQITNISVGTGVTFSGKTTNYFPKWSANTLTASSNLFDDGVGIGIGTASSLTQILTIANSGTSVTGSAGIAFRAGNDAQQRTYSVANIVAGYTDFNLWSNSYLKVQTHIGNVSALTDTATFTNGKLGILTASPTSALDVSGVITCSSVNATAFNGTASNSDTLDGLHAADFVTTGTTQTITGAKTFSNYVNVAKIYPYNSSLSIYDDADKTSLNIVSRLGMTTLLTTSIDWQNRILSGNWVGQSLSISGSPVITSSQTGVFASIVNLAATGSNLQTQINNLSVGGGVVFSGKTDNYLPKWSSNVLTATSKIFDNGTNVGINTNTPGNILSVTESGGAWSVLPTLGAKSGTFGVFSDGGNYGLIVGNANNGDTWMQNQRTDGTATAYNILLQPISGRVGIRNSAPVSALDVSGVITCSSVTATTFNGVATGADTLDGQHGSYYASVANLASTGSNLQTQINNITVGGGSYYPLVGNPSGFVMSSQTGVFSNADTLDGQHGSYYYAASNPNGYATQSWVTTQAYATSANLAATGSTLNSSIVSLSGTMGSTYYPKTNPSGYTTQSWVTNQGYATAANLATTGASLVSMINNISGVSGAGVGTTIDFGTGLSCVIDWRSGTSFISTAWEIGNSFWQTLNVTMANSIEGKTIDYTVVTSGAINNATNPPFIWAGDSIVWAGGADSQKPYSDTTTFENLIGVKIYWVFKFRKVRGQILGVFEREYY
jgi:hypothetical protein